jgi:hypothetical protein
MRSRDFSRKAENQPYIEWLWEWEENLSDVGEEEEEEDDENEDEDEEGEEEEEEDGIDTCGDMSENQDEKLAGGNDVEACEKCSIVRRFMKGAIRHDDDLQYPDQIERVADFSEQASSRESQESVALLDDSYGRTTRRKQRQSGRYRGPLTAQRLGEELSKEVVKCSFADVSRKTDTMKRFTVGSNQKAPESVLEEPEIRVM